MKGFRLSTVRRGGSLLVLFALNACSSADENEDDYAFGKSDMESALHGTWLGTWTPIDGAEAPFELVVRAPDGPATRMACGTRTFSESGPALSQQCVSQTSLGVSATATIEGEEPIALEGYAITASMVLGNAYLELTREGGPFRLAASWNSEAGFTSCNAYAADGAAFASCALDERR